MLLYLSLSNRTEKSLACFKLFTTLARTIASGITPIVGTMAGGRPRQRTAAAREILSSGAALRDATVLSFRSILFATFDILPLFFRETHDTKITDNVVRIFIFYHYLFRFRMRFSVALLKSYQALIFRLSTYIRGYNCCCMYVSYIIHTNFP